MSRYRFLFDLVGLIVVVLTYSPLGVNIPYRRPLGIMLSRETVPIAVDFSTPPHDNACNS